MEKLLVFLAVIQLSYSLDLNPSVKLPLGQLEGHVKKTLKGRDFYAFEGVPYAEPPINNLRFEAPVPAKSWPGVLQAKTLYKCIQFDHYPPMNSYEKVSGDEDCLYLNIYTPDVTPSKKYNVLIYIHGGAFMFDYGGLYGPEMILEKDIVYVNINYRLGPMGFLSTEDDVVPGNNGIKDQTMAIKWVKENIDVFGGNPDSITIYGMSAGGASVQLQFLLPESQGFFHKGISQSGCMLNPWVLVEKPLEKALVIAKSVGCPATNSSTMVDCLKKKHQRQITAAVKHLQPWLYNPFSPFGIVVDSWASKPVLPVHPLVLLRKGLVKDLPWFISHVSEEGLYPASDFYNDQNIEYINKNWNQVMPYILHYNDVLPQEQLNAVSEKIRYHFFNDEKLTKENFHTLTKLIGDRLFIVDIEKGARLHSAALRSSSTQVYSYYFQYRGTHSESELRIGSNENIGVSHADDTSYILRTPTDMYASVEDRKISDFMIDTIVLFMETGKPNTFQGWTPLSKNVKDPWVQLHINSSDNMYMEEKNMLADRVFWESLPFEENERIIKHDEL